MSYFRQPPVQGPLMLDEYRCALCGKIFAKAWSDDEAAAEAKEKWGLDRGDYDEADAICDPCNDEFMEWYRREEPWKDAPS